MSSCLMAKELPDKLTSLILLKVAEYDKRIYDKNTLVIHVVDDDLMAEALRKLIGKKIGNAVLSKVTTGYELPGQKVDIIFIGEVDNVKKYLNYSRANKVISVTNKIQYVSKGITLAIYDDEGMPGVILNTMASFKEGVEWFPEILEIAKLTNK